MIFRCGALDRWQSRNRAKWQDGLVEKRGKEAPETLCAALETGRIFLFESAVTH
jgi:hypothetical protein